MFCQEKADFECVCADLAQLSTTPQHAYLTWDKVTTSSATPAYCPRTCAKPCWFTRFVRWLCQGGCFSRTTSCDKAAAVALQYFTFHPQQWCIGHSDAIGKLLALPLQDVQLRLRIMQLWQQVVKQESLYAESEYIGAEQTIQIATKKEELELLEKKISMQSTRLLALEQSILLHRDLVVICADNAKVFGYSELVLSKIPFFKTYINTLLNHDYNKTLSALERQQNPHVINYIELTTASEHAVSVLLQTASVEEGKDCKNSLLDNIENWDFNFLTEVYLLADYLMYDDFKTLCYQAYQEPFSDLECLQLLSTWGLNVKDPFVQRAINCVIDNFDRMTSYLEFCRIQPTYLLEIIRSDAIWMQSEREICARVQHWIKAQDPTLLVGEWSVYVFVQQLRLEHFAYSELEGLDILPADEMLALHTLLKNAPARSPRPLAMTIDKREKEMQLQWRIAQPSQMLYTHQKEVALEETFICLGDTWTLKLDCSKDRHKTLILETYSQLSTLPCSDWSLQIGCLERKKLLWNKICEVVNQQTGTAVFQHHFNLPLSDFKLCSDWRKPYLTIKLNFKTGDKSLF